MGFEQRGLGKNIRSYNNYDTNGDLIGYVIQNFISDDNWKTTVDYTYLIDGNRNRLESIRKSIANGVLDFSRKVNYFYSQHEVISSVQSIDPKLKIYPNPTYSVLNLENLNGYEKATIYDINGKLLVQKVISNDVEKIDLSNLTNGIYFLRLVNKNTDIVTKIIKN
ncbi:MAG: T9SS type A sorting domain-containing protein [Saprospiraceae bacterium]|nr:T9SS type A sorting domain-containing protein [Saprospiraceae bacterium]